MALYYCSGGVKTLSAILKHSQQMFQHSGTLDRLGCFPLRVGGREKDKDRWREVGMDGAGGG